MVVFLCLILSAVFLPPPQGPAFWLLLGRAGRGGGAAVWFPSAQGRRCSDRARGIKGAGCDSPEVRLPSAPPTPAPDTVRHHCGCPHGHPRPPPPGMRGPLAMSSGGSPGQHPCHSPWRSSAALGQIQPRACTASPPGKAHAPRSRLPPGPPGL